MSSIYDYFCPNQKKKKEIINFVENEYTINHFVLFQFI